MRAAGVTAVMVVCSREADTSLSEPLMLRGLQGSERSCTLQDNTSLSFIYGRHSFIHSLTDLFIQPLTQSLVYLLIYSPMDSLQMNAIHSKMKQFCTHSLLMFK